MKTIISYIWLVLLLLLMHEEGMAQTFVQPTGPLTTTLSGNSSFNYEHGQEVVFDPDFEYTPNSPNALLARINEKLYVPDISYVADPETYASNRQLNTNLKVGTIEGFADVSANGLANYTIPVYTPPGTAGMVPGIKIQYLAQKESGLLGFGWDVAGLTTITRTGRNLYLHGNNSGITFTNADVFSLDGQPLIPVSGSNGTDGSIYDTENASFTQIICNGGGSGNGPGWFLIKTKEGTEIEIGNSDDSKISNNGATLIWKISKIRDANGNYIRFSYRNDGHEILIDKIEYTGNEHSGLAPYNSLEFFYTKRQDVQHKYYRGMRVTSSLVLSKVESHCEGNMVRRLSFNYKLDQYTKLIEVKESDGFNTEKNSTLIFWEQQRNTATEYGPLPAKWIASRCDANGDGKPDYVIPIYASAHLYNMGVLIEDPQTGNYNSYTLPGGITFDDDFLRRPFLAVFDFDKNGRDEIYVRVHQNSNGVEYYQYFGFEYDKTSNAFVALGSSHFITQVLIPAVPGTPEAQDVTYIIPTDVNGDGINEASFYRKSAATGMIFEIRQYDFQQNTLTSFNPYFSFTNTGSLSGVTDVQVVDFDGDRRTDFSFYDNGTLSILSLDLFTNSSRTITTATGISVNSDLRYWADFNGDGNTDLLVRTLDGDGKTTNWLFYYSDGSQLVFQQDLDEVLRPYGIRLQPDLVEIQDFNNDNKADLLFGFRKMALTDAHLDVFYSSGSSFRRVAKPHLSGSSRDYLFEDLVFTDMNGDGICDAYGRLWAQNTLGYTYSRIYFDWDDNQGYTGGNAVRAVTNGVNIKTEFEYANIKQVGTWIDNYPNGSIHQPNPYYVFDPASASGFSSKIKYLLQPVVVAMNTKHHNSGKLYERTQYVYTNAIYSDTKGFGGFTGIKTTTFKNGVERSKTIRSFSYNNTFEESYPVSSTTYLNGNFSASSSNSYTYSFSSLGGKRFRRQLTGETATDHVNGITASSSYTQDSYGNITQQQTSNGFSSTITTSAFINVGSFCPNKVSSLSVQKTVNGNSTSSTSAFTYDAYGNVLTSTAFDGMDKSVTTTYTYNAAGLPLSKTVSSPGLASVSEHYTYDDQSRFALEHYNPLNQKTETSYLPATGKVSQQKSVEGLVTQYAYDGWGDLTRSTDALDISSTISMSWGNPNADENNYYSSSVQKPGTPGTTTVYDLFGRKRKETTRNPAGTLVSVNSNYDDDGFLVQRSKPYLVSETPQYINYTYDNTQVGMSRIKTAQDPETGLSITYTYGAKELAVRKDGGSGMISNVTKRFNNDGSLASLSDLSGSTLSYDYSAFGSLKSVNGPDGEVSLAYDEYGRQSSMTDADAGTVAYEYNAYGQLTRQVTAEGTTIDMEYDVLGRLTLKNNTTKGQTVSYTYVSSGNGLNQVKTITGWNGNNQSFTYDEKGRLVTLKETVSGACFNTHYTYNSLGQAASLTFPSGYGFTRLYNSYGFCSAIAQNSNNSLIWQASTYNNYGQPTQELLADNYKLVKTYAAGYPLTNGFVRPDNNVMFQRNYAFDQASGNLDAVTDPIKGIIEDYHYDVMQRLSRTQLRYIQPGGIVKGDATIISYTPGGNISGKTDVSADPYLYNGLPHAVSDIPNPLTSIPSFTQTISYDSWGLLESISENDKTLSFSYGPDDQRKKTHFEEATHTLPASDHYYIGDYEKVVTDGITKEYHYLYSPNGLLAVMIRGNGSDNLNYAYTDYLGSILALVNIRDNQVEEYATDAWGRRRNPADWTTTGVPVPQLISRCFTGHEHLDDFGIINMNARLYDPVIGRMLGPDNFVQDLENTQNLNRFSYAFNNPLRYTDPDGNVIKNSMNTSVLSNPTYNQEANFIAQLDMKAIAEEEELLAAESRAGGGPWEQFLNKLGYTTDVSKSGYAQWIASGHSGRYYGGDGSGSMMDNTSKVLDVLNQFNPIAMGWDVITGATMGVDHLGNPQSGLETQLKLVSILPFGRAAAIGSKGFSAENAMAKIAANSAENAAGSESRAGAYDGMKAASKFLQEIGVERKYRVQILQSFEAQTLSLRTAGKATFGMRFFGGEAEAVGRYLFPTFTSYTNRVGLALPTKWNNAMTGLAQFQVESGTKYLFGRAATQGGIYTGGSYQLYIPSVTNLIRLR